MVSVDDIRNKTFQTVRFKEGYDVDEVDDFLDQVVDRMKASRPMTATELDAQAFHTVREPTPSASSPSGIHDDPRANGWDAGAASVSGNDPFSGDEAQIPW